MLDLLVKPRLPQAGAAFNPTDLILMRSWSEFHGLTMSIDLGRRVAGIPCDETVGLSPRKGPGAWLLWRDQDSIVITSSGDATHRFPTVPDALEAILPPPMDMLTDIQPDVW